MHGKVGEQARFTDDALLPRDSSIETFRSTASCPALASMLTSRESSSGLRDQPGNEPAVAHKANGDPAGPQRRRSAGRAKSVFHAMHWRIKMQEEMTLVSIAPIGDGEREGNEVGRPTRPRVRSRATEREKRSARWQL